MENKQQMPNAFTILKMAVESGAPARGSDILDVDKPLGVLADYLTPLSFGGHRAGRAKAMSRAVGKHPGMSVSYPNTDATLRGLGGAGLGGLLGAGLGAGAGAVADYAAGKDLAGVRGGSAAFGAGAGGGAGAAIGGLLAVLGAAANRRKKMREIVTDYDNAETLKPERPDFGMATSLAATLGGSHRLGQLDAYRQMHGQKSRKGIHRGIMAASHLLPPAMVAAGLPPGAVVGLRLPAILADSELEELKQDEQKKKPVTQKKQDSAEAEKSAACWFGEQASRRFASK